MSAGDLIVRMKIKIINILIIALLASSSIGCGTIIVASEGRKEMLKDKELNLWPVYTRTHFDLWIIYSPFWALLDKPKTIEGKVYGKSILVVFGPALIVLGAVDLPLALVFDTITLPWDYGDIKASGDNESISKTTI